MQGRPLLLDNLSTGVGNLKITANGEVNLGAEAFNVPGGVFFPQGPPRRSNSSRY